MSVVNGLTAVQRFRRLLKVDNKEITHVYVYALFNGLVNLSLPLGIQAIINLIQGGAISTSWMIMVGIVILGISLTGFFQYMQLRIVENISQKIFARSSFEFAYRFPKINYRALYNYYAPELANRFFDTLTIQKSLPKILIDFSLASFQIIVGLFVLSLYHSFFVFFAILLLILVFFLINYIGPMGMKTNLKESKYKYDVAYWLEEVARTKVTFKLSPDNTINIENTDGKVLNYINARESHFKVLVHQFFWLILFKVLIAAALLIIGGILVFRQEMNIGQFVAAEIIILLVLASIEKIITSLESIYDLLTALEKIGYVTDLPLDKEKPIPQISDEANNISVQLENVSYTFPDSKRKTLKNININFPGGSKVGIYGENGSGKTTLLHIISGLFEPDEGVLFFNGVAFSSTNILELRKNTGYVLSSLDIFSGSILENITMGRKGIGINEVVDVLEKVRLRDYVATLPMGLDTKLDPEGKRIALSIANKICLARALVSKPKLLIMDSPLEHLDYEDKTQIMNYLIHPSNNFTLIITSSDDEWKSILDFFYTMDNGKIIKK
jgi:ABC-type bacteriocin/lantibiotic exporter with double-glycine peptidase domain